MPGIKNEFSVADIVKTNTTNIHTEVEEILIPVLSNLRSRQEYANILKMFYGYYQPIENLIDKYVTPEHLPDIDERRKAESIINDLNALDIDATNIPISTHLPAITNKSLAIGALYVLEGSTLGGKMIEKMLLKNQQLQLTKSSLTFFSGYKDSTGTKWKHFVEFLNEQEDVDQISKGANETFMNLKQWMLETLNR